MLITFALIASYLVGSIPFGFLIGRWHGIDIRSAGSGNIGATNVGRLLGRRVGILVLALDFLKGAVPVLVGCIANLADWLPIAAGLVAFLGHVFPVWLKFRGGKGVATGFGVVTVLLPLPTLAGLLVWIATVAATRYISLASIFGGLALTGTYLVMTPEPFAARSCILTGFCLIALGLVVARHVTNLVRLWQGRENQIEESPAMHLLSRVLHVLSVGLWFGSSIFFTFVAAILIFKTLEGFGEMPRSDRPHWLPFREFYEKETGTRLAGATVSPMFPAYFMIQGACGLLALVTSLGFSRAEPRRKVHRWRFYVLLVAVLTVIIGWPLNQHVSKLRLQRFDSEPQTAQVAKEQFGRWHTYALFLNMGTIGFVTVAMGMAAALPQGATGKTPVA